MPLSVFAESTSCSAVFAGQRAKGLGVVKVPITSAVRSASRSWYGDFSSAATRTVRCAAGALPMVCLSVGAAGDATATFRSGGPNEQGGFIVSMEPAA
mmetsp:Transcript_28456/g.64568  ORF Transcript_28456/g.64568 Transcript_28456/m.64568 type:complete len:98 (+) Transcript_28456:566-859(+)